MSRVWGWLWRTLAGCVIIAALIHATLVAAISLLGHYHDHQQI